MYSCWFKTVLVLVKVKHYTIYTLTIKRPTSTISSLTSGSGCEFTFCMHAHMYSTYLILHTGITLILKRCYSCILVQTHFTLHNLWGMVFPFAQESKALYVVITLEMTNSHTFSVGSWWWICAVDDTHALKQGNMSNIAHASNLCRNVELCIFFLTS